MLNRKPSFAALFELLFCLLGPALDPIVGHHLRVRLDGILGNGVKITPFTNANIGLTPVVSLWAQ
jgi:hypothetical protein